MSLFITDLAFSEDSLVEAAKLGILCASLVAGVVGWTILRVTSRPR
jgi:NhaA family Na+:H+ antiporter